MSKQADGEITDDDIATMRILFNAEIGHFCNQGRHKDAEEMEQIRDRLMARLQADEWIPVSEPPKELGTYLIQTDGEPYMCQCRWTDVNPFWTDYKTKPHWNIFDLPQYSKVVAWMPLPKPYKAESEVQE